MPKIRVLQLTDRFDGFPGGGRADDRAADPSRGVTGRQTIANALNDRGSRTAPAERGASARCATFWRGHDADASRRTREKPGKYPVMIPA
jgi:hypothetical protein